MFCMELISIFYTGTFFIFQKSVPKIRQYSHICIRVVISIRVVCKVIVLMLVKIEKQ